MIYGMEMKPVLITHIDFDGIGAEILFRKITDDCCEVHNCDYENVNEVVKEVVERIPMDEAIYITDISVSREVAELLDKRGNVRLFDHHKTAEWLNEYIWAKVDQSACGTKLFYDWLMKVGFSSVVQMYEQFVNCVDDYDRWIHAFPESKQLNQLLWLMGKESFVLRFLLNPSIMLKSEEEFLLAVDNVKKANHLLSYEGKVIMGELHGHKAGVVFSEQYPNDLAHYLLGKEDIEVAVIVNMKNAKVSIRGNGRADCSEIAKAYGGGGHKNASGWSIDGTKLESFLFEVFE